MRSQSHGFEKGPKVLFLYSLSFFTPVQLQITCLSVSLIFILFISSLTLWMNFIQTLRHTQDMKERFQDLRSLFLWMKCQRIDFWIKVSTPAKCLTGGNSLVLIHLYLYKILNEEGEYFNGPFCPHFVFDLTWRGRTWIFIQPVLHFCPTEVWEAVASSPLLSCGEFRHSWPVYRCAFLLA